MFVVIGIMFMGIGVGYLLRRVRLLQKLGTSIQYTIYLLLFSMGISVGANPEIVNNLSALGGEALLIAVASTLGSLCMAWVVYHCFFKQKGEKQR